MKTIQLILPDDVHQRLRYYAMQTKQTMADAARMVFASCLPDLPGQGAEDAQGEERKEEPEGSK